VSQRSILVIATLDTKEEETLYLVERIRERGGHPIVLDSGILGEPRRIHPDIAHDAVAAAAGVDLKTIRSAGSRGAAVEIMQQGVARVAERLVQEGRIGGVVCIGGAEGAVMGAAAMDRIPVGIPKILVTPLASGARPFGLFVGTKDVMILHSVVDIAGLNPINRALFDHVARAIVAMAQTAQPIRPDGPPLVAVTMLGVTTPAVTLLAPLLQKKGYRPVVFHANGTGGRAMEEHIEQGMFRAVIDLTLNEITGHLVGGFHDGGPMRLETAGRLGLPQVVVPGAIEFIVEGPLSRLDPRWRGRPYSYHNPQFTLVRISQEEAQRVGEAVGMKLNRATGPVRLLWPRGGLSTPNRPGGELFDPDADSAFLEALRRVLRRGIPLVEVEAHINDPLFAEAVAGAFEDALREAGGG